INAQLRGVLDEATGKWGIRVNRVELKAIDPPISVQESMEKQMKAERDRRAAILNAEGVKQSNILTAEGEKQSQILRAEGSAQARILEAQGQARAIQQVFDAIHRGKPTQKLLAYQYLQVLPQIARGDSNKMWIIPSELTDALRGIGGALGKVDQGGPDGSDDDQWVDPGDEPDVFQETALEDPAQALAEARGQAGRASQEATEHAAPVQRVQPPIGRPADAVPEREPGTAPDAAIDPAPATGMPAAPPVPPTAPPVEGTEPPRP
ncbi:MAG TPA: SPFH domain-containing protein, partial [Pedococcus sp.]|nr:SPFH domain-containing protein [Pedococcus sp.]